MRSDRVASGTQCRRARLPAAGHELLLHLPCRRDRRRRAGNVAGAGINDRDRIAGALRQGLVELRLRRLEVGGSEGVGCRGEDEAGGRLELVLQRRRVGRSARQRRSVRTGGVDGLQIVVSKQVERAEDLVVLQVERAGGLEVAAEGDDVGSFDGLLRGPDVAELLVVVGGSRARLSPGAAAGVVLLRVVHVHVVVGSAVVEV